MTALFFKIVKFFIYEKENDKFINRSIDVSIDDGYATHSIKTLRMSKRFIQAL